MDTGYTQCHELHYHNSDLLLGIVLVLKLLTLDFFDDELRPERCSPSNFKRRQLNPFFLELKKFNLFTFH